MELKSNTSADTAIPVLKNALKSTGEAWPALEEKIDDIVSEIFKTHNLPGMTVAVTKEGRLLLSKGYGYALVDGTKKLPMKPCTRARIGSVTKCTVTGPSGFQLMKSKNIDPTSTKLYGPKGLFGGMFDADINIGINLGIKENKPNAAKWKGWYEKITLQNLLDHRAGFIGSGDTKGAAKMFGVSEDELTYEQVHQHFLRTKPIYEPGTTPSAELLKELGKTNGDPYSNHGFGLWTLIIKKMSGKSYLDYVREDFLKPMKLHNAVQPERANPDSCDAGNHKDTANKKLETFPFEKHGLGLAAGGFRASAQALARIMVELDKKYTVEELDSMGWAKNSKGKLQHNGRLPGGTASVAMFPKGYISYNNLDLSEVHVAIITNISTSASDLASLANKIALAVPASTVPATFDLWKQGKSACSCEYTRIGVPSDQYQQVFNDALQSGYRLEWIDGYADDGKAHFNVIFRMNEPKTAWAAHHNMTGASYQQHFDKYRDMGYSLDHADSYLVGRSVYYAAIWTKSSGAFTAYHGRTAEEHQNLFDSLTSKGWRPKVISVVSVQGKRFYTALYTKQAIGSFVAHSFLTPAEYQAKFDQNKASGRHLLYLNTYLHEGNLRFSAIWAEKPEVSGFIAKHGLTAEQYQSSWEDSMSADLRTQAISGCEESGKTRYAVFWTK